METKKLNFSHSSSGQVPIMISRVAEIKKHRTEQGQGSP